MAIKKLVEVWDGKNIIENNINFLKQKTKEIHLPINDTNKEILTDLLDTYKKVPCAGIAANQIGYNKRIFIGMKNDEPDTEEQYKELRKDEPKIEKKEWDFVKSGIVQRLTAINMFLKDIYYDQKIVKEGIIPSELINNNALSDRTAIIASYALCGFANFGSIGIQLGGIGGMAPERRKDLSKLGMKAMIGGALASWLTATIAGILI